MKPPPLRRVDLWTKQVATDAMGEASRRLFDHIYTGFLDELRMHPDRGGPSSPRYRRFAGDDLLPRGRYATVCNDERGGDGGTLLAELSAYYVPQRTGPVAIAEVDLITMGLTTEYERAGYGVPEHGRAIDVMLLHPEATEVPAFAIAGTPRHFFPLRIERRRLDDVLDLRQPDAAAWFTRWASTLDSIARRPLFDFLDILPSLLSQACGGDDFCRVVGTALRRRNVRALVFPSARIDCGVRIGGGSLKAWSGWNLVEYGDGSRTLDGLSILVEGPWPASPTPRRTDLKWGPYPSPPIEILRGNGPLEGTWLVTGIGAEQRRRVQKGLQVFRDRRKR